MNRKPRSLKILEGNPGKRRLDEAEPTPEVKIPPMPNDIDTAAKKVWRRLTPILQRAGLITEADGDALANLCQIRSRLVQINKEIKKEKSLLMQIETGIDGTTREKISPYVTIEKTYLQLFRLYASDFGLTPRGRVGLAVGNSGQRDELEDMLD